MRLERKTEHIENYLKTEYIGDTLFSDVFLSHRSLADLGLGEIDTTKNFLGKSISFPLLINSMTGGDEVCGSINQSLASITKKFNIAMATGSEQVAFEETCCQPSFAIARKTMGDGIVLGNISARASLALARQAVVLVEADALQLHLNPAHELAMQDGDRDFRGILDNIQNIVEKLEVPVIVKEVGFGISREIADLLYDRGVRIIDIAGSGGTNFLEIEDLRNIEADFSDLYSWGNPTAYLLETYRDRPDDLTLIASGGIKTSLDLVKALVMGADLVGMSGEILSYLLMGDEASVDKFLTDLVYKTKCLMVLLGAGKLDDLRRVPYKLTGKLKDLTE